MGKMSFPENLVLKHFYNQMDKLSRKAEYRFQKCLGDFTSGYVKKFLPGFIPPVYFNSMAYVRIGNTVVLLADADYYTSFPDSKTKVFAHHLHPAYIYLAEKLPPTP